MDVVGSNLEGEYRIHACTKTLKRVPLGGGGVLIPTAPPHGTFSHSLCQILENKKKKRKKKNGTDIKDIQYSVPLIH